MGSGFLVLQGKGNLIGPIMKGSRAKMRYRGANILLDGSVMGKQV